MTNLQETSVKNLDIKKELCFDFVIIKLYNVPTKCKCNRKHSWKKTKRGINMANKRCKSLIGLTFYKY